MRVFELLSKKVSEDRRALQKAAVALHLNRGHKSKRRSRELEVSELIARCYSTSPSLITGWVFLAIVLVFFRPFGTDLAENKFLLSLFWLIGVLANYLLVHVTQKWLLYLVMFPFGIAAYGASVILLYTPVAVATVYALVLLFPEPYPRLRDLDFVGITFFFFLTILAMYMINILTFIVQRHPAFVGCPGPTRLLSQIPIEKRGNILALSAEDHYVRIYTTSGDALIRMKFSDALDLVEPEMGFRIHRSHWVASGAVERLDVDSGGGSILVLPNGTRLPVARSRSKELEALLASGSF